MSRRLSRRYAMLTCTRPTHYTVIHDEIGLKADEIQGVTHSLSYMFAPATQAVSLVSPAYYADIASKRGFCYLRCGRYSENSDWTSTAEEEVTMTEANLTEARRVWYTVGGVPGRKLSDTMFYI
ncbi:hypothetical protein PAXINDRAFT_98799 [Paxillus involutus ATCC 200175]|nr:hypothetical protein PAXINDRAFT_98799 [Paxillus involutus ATCC 200175]